MFGALLSGAGSIVGSFTSLNERDSQRNFDLNLIEQQAEFQKEQNRSSEKSFQNIKSLTIIISIVVLALFVGFVIMKKL